MYYKGNVSSLWDFLSDIFHQYEEEDLYSPSALSSVPHLAHLLLRDVECQAIIRDLIASEDLKSNFNRRKYVENLSRLIDTPSIDPRLKVRAMAIRVIEQLTWKANGVLDLDGNPASEEIKQRSLKEAQEALKIAEGFPYSKALLEEVLYTVKRCLRLATEDTWAKVCTEAKAINRRDDMYFALRFLADGLSRAFYSQEKEVEPYFTEIAEIKISWGECGKMLAEYWERHLLPILESPTTSPMVKTTMAKVFDQTTVTLPLRQNGKIDQLDRVYCKLGENKG